MLKKNIKKVVSYIISKLYISAEKQSELRRSLDDVPFDQFPHIIRFLLQRSRQKSILLIEGNSFHGEVMPGLVKYCNELGYHVDVLLTRRVIEENPFTRCNLKMKIFEIAKESLAALITLEQLKHYETVLINSSRQWDGVPTSHFVSFKQYFGRWPKGKRSPILMAHDVIEIDLFFDDEPELKKRVVMLGPFNPAIMVNAHYFGEYPLHRKNATTCFTMIGALISARRNHQQLISIIQELVKENLQFQLNIIGLGTLSELPKEIHPYVRILGRLSFADMFCVLEKSDYLIAGLDPDNPEHDRYITQGVTGTNQLSYGFTRPLIIEEKFASFYGFNHENAIVYTRDLKTALERAIATTEEEYSTQRDALASLATAMRKSSKAQLKRLIEDSGAHSS